MVLKGEIPNIKAHAHPGSAVHYCFTQNVQTYEHISNITSQYQQYLGKHEKTTSEIQIK
jgi:hypothetical protein